jgi:hypothetical protein
MWRISPACDPGATSGARLKASDQGDLKKELSVLRPVLEMGGTARVPDERA